jgi:hypothetical protein
LRPRNSRSLAKLSLRPTAKSSNPPSNKFGGFNAHMIVPIPEILEKQRAHSAEPKGNLCPKPGRKSPTAVFLATRPAASTSAESLRKSRNGTSVKNFTNFPQGNNSRFDFDLSGLTGSPGARFATQTVDILARDFYCE